MIHSNNQSPFALRYVMNIEELHETARQNQINPEARPPIF